MWTVFMSLVVPLPQYMVHGGWLEAVGVCGYVHVHVQAYGPTPQDDRKTYF